MKIFFVFGLLLLAGGSAQAKDSWTCTEASSIRTGNAIHSCGVATNADEAAARAAAFANAKMEFDSICSASSDCRGHQVNLEPARTTCEPTDGGIQCRRMVLFHIQEEMEELPILPGEPDDLDDLEDLEDLTPDSIPEAVKPAKPRIEKGMKKSEVLAAFGKPEQVVDATMQGDGGGNRLIFSYRGHDDFCDVPNFACSVYLKDGEVNSFNGFRPSYTGVFDEK